MMRPDGYYREREIEMKRLQEMMEQERCHASKIREWESSIAEDSPVSRTTIPIVAHLAQLNSRLVNIEDNLRVVRSWITGEDGVECEESQEMRSLEGQIFKTETLIDRIEEILSQVKNRLI